MTPEQQRLADRILKLLALASSTTFAGEAANARRLAEELISRHNIKLESKDSQQKREIRSYRPFAAGAKWELILTMALCDLCCCNVYFDHNLSGYAFVGTIFNLDCLEYMLNEVKRQRIAAWLQYKPTGSDSFHKFCYGFATALETKINAIISNRTSLEKEKQALLTWYEQQIGRKVTGRDDIHMGNASSAAGSEAGRSASLHRGALGTPAKQIGQQKKLR